VTKGRCCLYKSGNWEWLGLYARMKDTTIMYYGSGIKLMVYPGRDLAHITFLVVHYWKGEIYDYEIWLCGIHPCTEVLCKRKGRAKICQGVLKP